MSRRDTPLLETSRLRLRPRTADDAEALFPALSDPELMTWWSSAPHADLDQTRTNFAQLHEGWRNWAITLRDDGNAVGFVALGQKRQGVSELGYLVTREHWGKGIAREAVSVVISHAFAEGQRRLFADTDPDNVFSRRLLESLGFRLEGILREEWETHIGVRDTALYGLLRREWASKHIVTPPSSCRQPNQRD